MNLRGIVSRAAASAATLHLLIACSAGSDAPRPPVAATQPHRVVAEHGAARDDEYYWLRDDTRSDERMLDYLRAENAYADALVAPLAGSSERLFEEIVGRLQQDDSSVPYRYRGYWYYQRFEVGQEYPIHARRRGTLEAEEEILLDGNALAAGQDYFAIGNYRVSPDNRSVAYLEDVVGRRQYRLRVKDLTTGAIGDPGIGGLSRALEWSADSSTLFYIENDPVTLLATRVKAHRLGTDPGEDLTIYEEADDTFYMSLMLTRSEKYLCIVLESTVSGEQRCAERADPTTFRTLASRQRDFEYQADHLGERWVVRTNWDARNFKLMVFEDGVWNDRGAWVDWVAHDDAVLITGFELFAGFTAIGERADALTRIRVLDAGGDSFFVAADEAAYTMYLSGNAEPDTDWLRYEYSSLTTPTSTFELNVDSGERRLLKEEPVLGGFDKNDYVTERLWAEARDGSRLPVSVLYRAGFEKNGTGALLQYAYGSYGLSTDPEFESDVLSLVDRGVVYALAHVRGGAEMGRHWYDDGKLLNKMNTFTDFIDTTDFLVAEGFAAPDRVAAMGGSAGGLLMGAIANLAPEKYRVIVSLVPFVDVVTTMLDESIPLTTNEFDEWGNPQDPVYYAYMLSYSPYDQLAAKAYPAMYVYTGLWDSQVQYWEPAKYVARLRARRGNDEPLLLRTEMEAGHGGSSGRFQRYRETAEQFAFMLDRLGVDQ